MLCQRDKRDVFLAESSSGRKRKISEVLSLLEVCVLCFGGDSKESYLLHGQPLGWGPIKELSWTLVTRKLEQENVLAISWSPPPPGEFRVEGHAHRKGECPDQGCCARTWTRLSLLSLVVPSLSI